MLIKKKYLQAKQKINVIKFAKAVKSIYEGPAIYQLKQDSGFFIKKFVWRTSSFMSTN